MTDEQKSRLPITYLRKVPADILGTFERKLTSWSEGEDLPKGLGGICMNLGLAIGCFSLSCNSYADAAHNAFLSWAERSWRSWEHFSNNVMYPVPTYGFEDASVGYDYHENCYTLWKGDQLFLRKKLCKHLLAELAKDMPQLKAEWAIKENGHA